MRKSPYTGRSGLGRKFSYNDKVALWWLERANDNAHKYAYKNIANFIRASFRGSPRLIVDYACGAGNLLSLLSRRFAHSKLVGLDGSSLLLGLAERRFSRLPHDCAKRISLIETPLPKPDLLRSCADLVVFCYPNMMSYSREEESRAEPFQVGKIDRTIARSLSLAKETSRGEGELPDPLTVQNTLERGRCISRNLRSLLVRGGICVRVEYATTRRHEWSALELQQVSFEEGTLDTRVDRISPRKWFRVLASAYFRSRVLEDVYQQTGDKRDRNGGYLITVLRAL
jgi:SAM-dependent methyltransferase